MKRGRQSAGRRRWEAAGERMVLIVGDELCMGCRQVSSPCLPRRNLQGRKKDVQAVRTCVAIIFVALSAM
jgi:protein involved in ribonucleotide reduction